MRSGQDMRNQQDMTEEENMGICPVCRKVFQAKDLEHVLNLVGSQSSLQISDGNAAVDVNKELLQSDSENLRRQKFEAILKLQQERSGLIEPKKDLLVVPGMFLPQPTTFTNETSEHGQKELPVRAEVNSCGSSKRPNTSKHRNSGARKERVTNPQKQVRQWVRKDNSTAD